MPSQRELALATNYLRVTVMPTEKCNFRCTYCYEDFEQGRMSADVVDGLKLYLSRRAPALDHLVITWFGGEPLLAADIIEEVQKHALDLQRNNERLKVSSRITTNGYLLEKELLRRLLKLGISRYQISVDGLPHIHDRGRPRADGEGTFERIWENLVGARQLDADYQIKVRVHVDRRSAKEFPRFLDLFRSAFSADPRFRIFVRAVSQLGGPNDSEIPVFADYSEEERVVGSLRQLVDSAGLHREPTTEASDSVCYAAAPNAFVIRSNGDVAKCTVALRHPRNRIGRLQPDGTLGLDSRKALGWIRGIFTGDPEELACPMKGYAESSTPQRLPILS